VPGVGARQEVFFHREVPEAVPPFHDLNDAPPHELPGVQAVDPFAAELDRAFGHGAALGAEQVRDRLQRRRLPGAVGSQERHDLSLRDFEGNPFQHQDHVVVDDLDVVDGKKGASLPGHRSSYSLEQSRGVIPFSLA
jgi:hypothetical protein